MEYERFFSDFYDFSGVCFVILKRFLIRFFFNFFLLPKNMFQIYIFLFFFIWLCENETERNKLRRKIVHERHTHNEVESFPDCYIFIIIRIFFVCGFIRGFGTSKIKKMFEWLWIFCCLLCKIHKRFEFFMLVYVNRDYSYDDV